MSSPGPVLPGRPAVGVEVAARVAAERYRLEGDVTELPSDRDRNFRVDAAGGPFVLKLANAREDRAILEAQDRALARLEQSGLGIAPRVVADVDGNRAGTWESASGVHGVRLVTWVAGAPLADVRDRPRELLEELGRVLARVDGALAGLELPPREAFDWDLARAGDVLAGNDLDGEPAEVRALVAHARARFTALVAPRLDGLPRAPIHNDANDWNVLVARRDAEPFVSGLIDFGDMALSIRVAEPAVAIAYAMLDAPDPLAVAAAITAGYDREQPLSDTELDVVWELARARLAVSLCMSARQRRLEPDNDYLLVSREPAIRSLSVTLATPPALARAVVRTACGRTPSPRGAEVTAWLEARRGSFAAPLDHDGTPEVLDLSVASPDFPSDHDPADVRALIGRLTRYARAGAPLGIGRYDEARLLYAESPAFTTPWGEPRTVHLGVDLFAPAGTAVRAPLAGRVHSTAVNDRPLDYGPTVILRHEPPDGPAFWTLYGHLARASIEGLEPGRAIAAGEAFAALGAPDENGGWPPHLHFQVVADLPTDGDAAGTVTDVAGVAPPSRRDAWLALCPDPSPMLGVEVAAPRTRDLLARRRRLLGHNLSISYRAPLHVVRGRGAVLFDADGRRYVDLVNNVCHVGHCHPRVVRAATRQIRTLNTNTRYLHENVLRYAEKLLAKFPAPLDTVFFVNSGSEANDLALRLARAVTGAGRFVCLDGAYHGHVTSLIEVSPYKHDGPGGHGTPAHVHKVAMPDVYRGAHRGPDAGARYTELVAAAAGEARDRGGLAAFLHESLLGCGGQIPLPDGYLRGAYAAVHAAGGICIADEVQVGFGRVGDAFWGFELQDVVPDVVTLGKPIGNGHPLAAVVTTAAIAAAFDDGMEYFNTYGGNPVSAAVGEAVLDVIEDEGLQRRAKTLGKRLMDGLWELGREHERIGDVRGRGLFVGVELVHDRDTLAPAADVAAHVVDRMRRRGFLSSTDGPLHNVIKIKPPMVLTEADVDATVRALGETLAALQP